MSNTYSVLERIAASLEIIAEHHQRKMRRKTDFISESVEVYLTALRNNADKLAGKRMSASEISDAIGCEVTRSDRAAFGRALTLYGVKKGKSGSSRYYKF